jgi:hypothetical protein
MDVQELKAEVSKKINNADRLEKEIEKNNSLIPAAIEGLNSPEGRIKFKLAKILKLLSRKKPVALYPYFDHFEKLLESPNKILKWNGMDILAQLSIVDSDDKFRTIMNKYFGLLREGNLITAAHVVENSAVIVKAAPDRELEITTLLADVERLTLPTEECRNILRGKVIETFDRYFISSANKETMLNFAQKQLTNRRPATQKKAADFVRKHSPLESTKQS